MHSISLRSITVSVALLAIGVTGVALVAHSSHGASRQRPGATKTVQHTGALPTSSEPGQPQAEPTQSSPVPPATPAPSAGKGGQVTPPPAAGGPYPFPLDAGSTVVEGQLKIDPASVAAGSTVTVSVSAPSGGWLAGQAIFLYVGHSYQLKLAGPGTSATLTLPSSALVAPAVEVSGFQFPGDSPAEPIDGYATVDLGVQN